MKKAALDDTVKIHYTGKLSDGSVFDTSDGRDPLSFTLGSGQVIPGFDKGVVGMQVDEEKTIEIKAIDAYGDIRDELIHELPKSTVPSSIDPKVGMNLVSKTKDGKEIPLVVTKISDETITVDANHPLAGKDLTFKVKLVEIQ